MITGKMFSLGTLPSAELIKTVKSPMFSLVFKLCLEGLNREQYELIVLHIRTSGVQARGDDSMA